MASSTFSSADSSPAFSTNPSLAIAAPRPPSLLDCKHTEVLIAYLLLQLKQGAGARSDDKRVPVSSSSSSASHKRKVQEFSQHVSACSKRGCISRAPDENDAATAAAAAKVHRYRRVSDLYA